ncbi:putative HTH-type transcriptional regulator YdfH [Hartmannibacter diazotrophicus]|uniref:Putative HTH-type transcriptional regulator YdfH n=1 Tax=Hartmannibacter diazotrophicus TaxID=1482074 RepID=A0A2C9D9C7_9HYPH|nr:GntR family transcriptional regulator [Hartmannibacter diazotrophicus]SON56934.1 putative HTH-type transcriptional regulator YdfH [Hartmannibacter diazotrophicus]
MNERIKTARSKRRPAGRTRTEDLRLQLADEIMRGELKPGTPLDEARIAARFGVSRTPVREALRQLGAGGLIELRPHRGAVVAPFSATKFGELFMAMAELEGLCAGMAAMNMTAQDRHEMERTHATLRDLIRTGDPQRYHEVNEAFHNSIYAGAHNSHIAELTLSTRLRLQPFRRAQFRNLARLALSYAEHDKVVQAILRGDRDGAATAMRDHIIIVRDAAEDYVESFDHPDFGPADLVSEET